MSRRLLVIIPAHNEAGALPVTIHEVLEALRVQETHHAQVLVVDDCSGDDTASIARSSGVEVISLPVNLGIGGAVQMGYRYALENGFDLAVQVDGDGQHEPAEIMRLVGLLEERGVDMVVGSRFLGESRYRPSLPRRLGMAFSRAVLALFTGRRVQDTTSGFRVVNRRLIRLFANDYPCSYAGLIPLAMVFKLGYTLLETSAAFRYRKSGTSYIRLGNALFYPIRSVLAVLGILLRSGDNQCR